MSFQSLSTSKRYDNLKAALTVQLIMATSNKTGNFNYLVNGTEIQIEFSLNHTYLEAVEAKKNRIKQYYSVVVIDFVENSDQGLFDRVILSSPLLNKSTDKLDYLIYEWMAASILDTISIKGNFVGVSNMSTRDWDTVFNTLMVSYNANGNSMMQKIDHFNYRGDWFGKYGYHMVQAKRKLKPDPPIERGNSLVTYEIKENSLVLTDRRIKVNKHLAIDHIELVDGFVQSEEALDFYKIHLIDGLSFIIDDIDLVKVTQH